MPKFFKKSPKKEENEKTESTLTTKQEQPRTESFQTLLWSSPVRPFRKRDQDWYKTVGAIVTAVIVILFFVKEFLFIAVVLAFVFMVFVLVTVPPQIVEHEIDKHGLNSMGHSYFWEDLKSFWFTKKDGFEILNIETKIKFPKRLLILLGEMDKNKVQQILEKHLEFKEFPEMSWMDKAAETLTKNLPLENPKK